MEAVSSQRNEISPAGNRRLVYRCLYRLSGIILLLLGSLILAADEPRSRNTASVSQTAQNDPSAEKTQTVGIDLPEILERGSLRIIVPSNLSGGLFLPRSDSPMDKQQALARLYAESLGVEAEFVPVLDFRDMLPALMSGEGDLIVANMTVTEERKKKLEFSVPVEHAHEVVLVHKDARDIKITRDLAGKKLMLDQATSFWKTGEDYKKRYPSIDLVEQGKGVFDEDVLDLIAEKKVDATIRDSNIAEMYLNYRDDLRIAFKSSAEQSLAWGLRPDSAELKKSLDQFLSHEKLATFHTGQQFGDLDAIKKRGVLRILLRNNASSYFLWRGELMGFEYEMAQAYAKKLGVRLVVLVPSSPDQVIEWLEQGKVDIAAGFLSHLPQWQARGIGASVPYHEAFQHIVVHKNNNSIKSARDLEGKTIVVRAASRHLAELEELKASGFDITIETAPADMEIEEIVENVAAGIYPMTLADEHILNIELASDLPVKSAFIYGDQQSHVLAVRGEDKKLLIDLNAYISRQKEGRVYSRLYKKYFTDTRQVRKLRKKLSKSKEMLSEYDDLVQRYAKKYGFDWRFITAQMFQESRFNPKARSHAGALGLMQLMPATGRLLGFKQLLDPSTNIHAGTKYMNWLFGKFDDGLPVVDRMWFTLASYNAGLGHVLDARRLAKQEGLNPDRWFNNVEKAMLLLSKARYARKARHGYVRGHEPVTYVRRIMKLYTSYLNIMERDTDQISKANREKMPEQVASNQPLESFTTSPGEIERLNADLENHPACCR